MSALLGGLSKGLTHAGRVTRNVITSRRFWIVTTGVMVTILLIQLIYPSNRALPFAKLDGQPVAFQTIDEITRGLNSRYAQAVIITDAPATKTSFKQAGLKLATIDSVNAVTDYPLWQRFIPLSSVVRMFNGNHRAKLTYQSLPLSQWSKQVSEKCEKKPIDAGIIIAGEGELKLTPAQTGTKCNEQTIIESLRATPAAPQLHVDTRHITLQPKRSDKQVSEQLGKLRKVLSTGITFDVSGTRTVADAKTITPWLTFSDGPNNTVLADVDPAKVQPFITQIQKPIYVNPGVTIVTMRDGVEVGRQPGASGRGIDSAKLLDGIRAQLREQKTAPVTATFAAIAPRQDIRRSYTNSTVGLQALLNNLTSGRDMAISIRELSGQSRSLSANGDKLYHPASTYKLFIAYSVIKRIEANQLAWGDQIEGKTVDDCLTRMIVNSDNACAEAFADKFTWGTVQSELKALGMTKTNLNSPSPVSTTNDQVAFLQKLEAGQLMKLEHKNKLIDLMKRQTYRSGIPAGAGVPVADKVGFLGGILHDSAIVYSPKGTYVISIYSNGGSWGNIADATRQISQLLSS